MEKKRFFTKNNSTSRGTNSEPKRIRAWSETGGEGGDCPLVFWNPVFIKAGRPHNIFSVSCRCISRQAQNGAQKRKNGHKAIAIFKLGSVSPFVHNLVVLCGRGFRPHSFQRSFAARAVPETKNPHGLPDDVGPVNNEIRAEREKPRSRSFEHQHAHFGSNSA